MKIAVIGGIGSGKSRVIACLKELGERTCDCDEIYNDVANGEEYIGQVERLFGTVKDGKVDRQALAKIVFSDREARKKLNNLAHPLIFKEVENIYSKEDSNLYIEVSAFDKSMAKYFDEIIFVKSSNGNRLQRVKARNNFEESYILSIMDSQLSDEEMQEVSDFVIVNDTDLEDLSRQVEYIIAFHNF